MIKLTVKEKFSLTVGAQRITHTLQNDRGDIVYIELRCVFISEGFKPNSSLKGYK